MNQYLKPTEAGNKVRRYWELAEVPIVPEIHTMSVDVTCEHNVNITTDGYDVAYKTLYDMLVNKLDALNKHYDHLTKCRENIEVVIKNKAITIEETIKQNKVILDEISVTDAGTSKFRDLIAKMNNNFEVVEFNNSQKDLVEGILKNFASELDQELESLTEKIMKVKFSVAQLTQIDMTNTDHAANYDYPKVFVDNSENVDGSDFKYAIERLDEIRSTVDNNTCFKLGDFYIDDVKIE